ncbi:hypothetical protein FKP32DRAFT_412075 [Trametes sanguinea]|nr:hypothetical protein FKP32DRAFT_412075 [Trametes sanguinea]
MKLFAAAALLMAGQCQIPLHGLDLETVTGLMRVVVNGLQERPRSPSLERRSPSPAPYTDNYPSPPFPPARVFSPPVSQGEPRSCLRPKAATLTVAREVFVPFLYREQFPALISRAGILSRSFPNRL